MKYKLLSILTLLFTLPLYSQTDTLTSHFPDYSDSLFHVGPAFQTWGFISGHHSFTDYAKAQKFDTSNGVPLNGTYEITSILFWIAAKEGTNSTSVSFAAVWEEAPDGKPYDSTEVANVPFQINVDTSTSGKFLINGNAYYNAVATFQSPIPLPESRKFWAGIQLTSTNYNAHEYVWLKTTLPGSYLDTTYVMDQWDDRIFRGINSWTNVKQFSYAIFPVIKKVQVSGDEELLEESISFYPNPVKDKLKVELSTGIENVQVTDALGRLVFEKDLSDEKVLEIDFSEEPIGSYFININTGTSNKSYHFLKQ